MKILAVMGTPRDGNTDEIVRYFEKVITDNSDVNIDYLFLRDYSLDFCTGCHNCIFKGENYCPHYLKIKEIEDKMIAVDGII
ncbi:MAG: NAD(P)H-dependent oxidoreductase [Spirochaetes bacterium]|nr:NAD(P)H-dependent oxidoreductase [Spirochaetota bacterium]